MEGLLPLGRHIPAVLGPTYEIYGGLLRKKQNVARIQSTPREEFSYGKHERQKLDVYTPTEPRDGRSSPILLFVHGGGFVSGGKRLDEISGDVVYTNLGHYFATTFGFTTVIINYRLISHGAKYPSGPEDFDLVLQWLEKQYEGRRDLLLFGNSAGGVHIASWLFGSAFAEHRNRLIDLKSSGLQIRAVGLLGVPFLLDPEGNMKPLLSAHYGQPELIRAEEPMALMRKATEGLSKEEVARWPPLSVLISELDPEIEIKESGKQFADAWRAAGGKGNFVEILGHNHISPVVSIGTGVKKEEAWCHDFGQWLTEQILSLQE